MPYIKQAWIDEVPSATPPEYKISQDADGDIATNAKIELVTPVDAGSPLNAGRLNYMEEGIETAQETAEAAQAVANDAVDDAAAAQATADAAIPKNLATAIGQILYSTAAGVWAVLNKPNVTSVLQGFSTGTFSWKPITDFATAVFLVSRRQGGNSTDWTVQGITTYNPSTNAKMMAGVIRATFGSSPQRVDVFFPSPMFTNPPLVFCTPRTSSDEVNIPVTFSVESIDQYQFTLVVRKNTASGTVDVHWMAIGE